MFIRQILNLNSLKINALLCIVLLCFVLSCRALDSCDSEHMVASEMMQPFDLKIVMKAIIDDALQKNMLAQLPQGFLAFYKALEQGSVIQYADLMQALPVIFTAIIPEFMQRIYHHQEKQKDEYTIHNVSEDDVHIK